VKNLKLKIAIHAVVVIMFTFLLCLPTLGLIFRNKTESVTMEEPEILITQVELEYEPTEIEAEPEIPDEIWNRYPDMTFGEMRESIMKHGAIAFKDATGIDIVFDNPNEIVSITAPHVMARGYSTDTQFFVDVLFTYQHWRDGWRVAGYSGWDFWNMQPQVTRGLREGRRHVEAETVEVKFYAIVDWGGFETAEPVFANIPGENFSE